MKGGANSLVRGERATFRCPGPAVKARRRFVLIAERSSGDNLPPNYGRQPVAWRGMICPRCGTVAAGQSASCTRCGGQLGHGASAAAVAEPPVPRAPTYRGELAQRAAGIVPQILARPKPPAPAAGPTTRLPGDLVAPSPEPVAAQPPASAPEAQAWPPPPAVWEPGPAAGPGPAASATGAATGAPTHASTPAPGWARPGPGWSRGGAPELARSAAGWARAIAGRGRVVGSPARTSTPANYLWQSLACLFLFLPSAVVAVVYSAQVNRRVQIGDMTGAIRASRLARTWCLVTVVVFTLLVLWVMAGGTPP
jgi:hypothetical protein